MRNLWVRLWEQLGCVVWTGRSDKIAVKLLAETVVPEDLTEARGYAFQVTHVMAVVRRPQFPACCWQDMFSSLQPGPLHRLFEYPHSMTANFSQRKWSKGEQGGIYGAFYDLFSRAVVYHFHFVRSESLNSAHTLGERIIFVSWEEYQQICGNVLKTTTLLRNQNSTIKIKKLTQIYCYCLILRSIQVALFYSNRFQVRITHCI